MLGPPHESFPIPDDIDATIWRYVDLAKLVSLLDSRSLFFARANTLSDPFEGSVTVADQEQHQREHDALVASGERAEMPNPMSRLRLVVRDSVLVSCWHMNEHESAAMWSQYAGVGGAVAIRSTFRRLCEAFETDLIVHVGLVQYIDFATERFRDGNALTALMTKRRSFEHEREVRAVIWEIEGPQGEGPLQLSTTPGIAVPVNLERLVEAIYVSPGSQRWFEDVVRSVVARFAQQFEVRRSTLDSQPLF